MIILRGVVLMAGPPTSSPNPGRVTVPTPGPATKRTSASLEAVEKATLATIIEPLVTSGSSPASLMTEQVALSLSHSVAVSGKVIISPEGRVMDAAVCSSLLNRAVRAALAAAVAQAPVV